MSPVLRGRNNGTRGFALQRISDKGSSPVRLQRGRISATGFVAMSVVIVFFIVAVSATLFMILVSWNAETGEGIARDGVRAKWHADACAEHALHELRNVPGYAGSQSLSFDDGGCAIPPFTASASFSLNAEGESGGAFARVLVSGLLSVNASGEVTAVQVLSREYVADF